MERVSKYHKPKVAVAKRAAHIPQWSCGEIKGPPEFKFSIAPPTVIPLLLTGATSTCFWGGNGGFDLKLLWPFEVEYKLRQWSGRIDGGDCSCAAKLTDATAIGVYTVFSRSLFYLFCSCLSKRLAVHWILN